MSGEGLGFGSAGNASSGDALCYPGVPYSSKDFNVVPRDLKVDSEYVRDVLADLLNKLVDGFRIDAAEQMWPGTCGPSSPGFTT